MLLEKIKEVNSKAAIEAFRILGSETRFEIICTLLKASGDICVNEIAEEVGVSPSATSHQLAKLEDKKVVRSVRKGQMICYKLEDNSLTKTLIKIIEQFG